jgi:hypothetical protein
MIPQGGRQLNGLWEALLGKEFGFFHKYKERKNR